MAQRTTHRSVSGKKLYAVRDSKGRFKDIQTYERAHRADLAHRTKGEKTVAKKARCREKEGLNGPERGVPDADAPSQSILMFASRTIRAYLAISSLM